ncbi:MAG: MCP four helix bundle domain-containing protein [Pirellulales bacterium]|nr:MCP four helix bundle domain-containing protein [Pirellulales bacterium]
MRLSLARKVAITLWGVVLLAIVSSVAAVWSTWQIGGLMHRTVTENLPSVRAAEELEIAVLEQRGFVASYLLDQSDARSQWLTKLHQREKNFSEWLRRAHETAHTTTERDILRRLEGVCRQYDEKRDEVVVLYDRGEAEAARELLLGDVYDIYENAYGLCEDYLDANEAYVETAVSEARSQIRFVTWTVSAFVFLTVAFGATLLWLFFYGVVFPLRAMAADARGFMRSAAPADDRRSLPTDELRTIGNYLHCLMSDVADTRTVLEQHRSQLKSAEKLASVGKLAASVAHEVRNPLTAIKMWLFSIQKDIGGNEELDRKFRIVSEEIHRLESIVRDFLEFSRPPELKRSRQPVPDLLEPVLELIEPRLADRGITLQRAIAPDLPNVLVDREQVKQVLLNLLINSVDATAGGGRISIAAISEVRGGEEEMVIIRISDSGEGIAEDVRPRLFEPFFSTKEQGTGLGLSIAAQIMARHQGRLVLESTGPEGTTFALFIPAAPRQTHG